MLLSWIVLVNTWAKEKERGSASNWARPQVQRKNKGAGAWPFLFASIHTKACTSVRAQKTEEIGHPLLQRTGLDAFSSNKFATPSSVIINLAKHKRVTPGMQHITLNNGLQIPQLGLGVWKADNGQEAINAIHWAIDAGYRHIDTAKIYKNEEAVGKALQTASVPRTDIWLTTKVWNDDIRAGRTAAAVDEALTRLGTDYIDLMLLHWPVDGYQAAWTELEQALASGKVRAIGLSNFMEEHLNDIINQGEILPAVNQIEYHPYLVQADAISLSDQHNIAITAWSPLMQGKFLEEPIFATIASAYGKTPAQVVLRWCLQNDIIVIPKSTNPNRIKENSGLFDFELSEEHMVAIDELERAQRFGPDPHDFDF